MFTAVYPTTDAPRLTRRQLADKKLKDKMEKDQKAAEAYAAEHGTEVLPEAPTESMALIPRDGMMQLVHGTPEEKLKDAKEDADVQDNDEMARDNVQGRLDEMSKNKMKRLLTALPKDDPLIPHLKEGVETLKWAVKDKKKVLTYSALSKAHEDTLRTKRVLKSQLNADGEAPSKSFIINAARVVAGSRRKSAAPADKVTTVGDVLHKVSFIAKDAFAVQCRTLNSAKHDSNVSNDVGLPMVLEVKAKDGTIYRVQGLLDKVFNKQTVANSSISVVIFSVNGNPADKEAYDAEGVATLELICNALKEHASNLPLVQVDFKRGLYPQLWITGSPSMLCHEKTKDGWVIQEDLLGLTLMQDEFDDEGDSSGSDSDFLASSGSSSDSESDSDDESGDSDDESGDSDSDESVTSARPKRKREDDLKEFLAFAVAKGVAGLTDYMEEFKATKRTKKK